MDLEAGRYLSRHLSARFYGTSFTKLADTFNKIYTTFNVRTDFIFRYIITTANTIFGSVWIIGTFDSFLRNEPIDSNLFGHECHENLQKNHTKITPY